MSGDLFSYYLVRLFSSLNLGLSHSPSLPSSLRYDAANRYDATGGRRRSGVSAERRHLKITVEICGGLPTRRYGAGERSAVPLKIRTPEFAGWSGCS